MKRLPLLLASIILLSFLSSGQGSLQASSQVKSSGTIEYSTQSLVIKHYTINCYGIFDTTPENYAALYDMTEADGAANVVAGIAQVKQIKPNFKALIYRNMRSVDSGSAEWQTFVDNNWLLKDSGGNIILTDAGYLIDFGNSACQNWVANYLKSRINTCGYDGVYGDNNLAWGASDYFWACSATAINPRTGNPWTDSQVREALIDYHTAVKNAIGSKLLCCNGIFYGYRFYQHQSAYQEILSASPLDGFMSEGAWYPNYDNPQWMSEQTWQQAVNFLVWTQDNWLSGHSNRFYVPVAKLARGNQVHTPLPSGCTLKQMATYAYTSTLLGAKTATAAQVYFSTFLSTSDLQTINIKQLLDAPIGTPTNNYYLISGTHVYARDFTKVKVLVNPTDQPYSVSLTQNYVTLDGQIVSSLNIGPHTGVILKSGT